MDQPSTSSDDDQPKPSLIYNGANWVPPPTSTETESGTQGFTVRYVQYSRIFFFAIILHHITYPCTHCNPWIHPSYIKLSRPKKALLNPISLPVFVSYQDHT